MFDMEIGLGSTAKIIRVRPGVILKSPRQVCKGGSSYQAMIKKIANNFLVERQILSALGEHPRIVKFVFPYSVTSGGLTSL